MLILNLKSKSIKYRWLWSYTMMAKTYFTIWNRDSAPVLSTLGTDQGDVQHLWPWHPSSNALLFRPLPVFLLPSSFFCRILFFSLVKTSYFSGSVPGVHLVLMYKFPRAPSSAPVASVINCTLTTLKSIPTAWISLLKEFVCLTLRWTSFLKHSLDIWCICPKLSPWTSPAAWWSLEI